MTKIADVIVPEVFNPYVIERTAELSALISSGILAYVPDLEVLAHKGGSLINMPFWNDLSGAEETLSDSGALTPGKITASQDIAVLYARGKAWEVNDLATQLSGDDPMAAIGDLVAAYWARRLQAHTISTLTGAFAAASMSGHVHDISGLTGGSEIISGDAFLDATQLLGDAKSALTGVAMHSAVENKLAKLDLIDYEPDSEGKPTIPYYLGRRVVVDDSCPVDTGTYSTYLFGPGALGYADSESPKIADKMVETDRDSLAGDDLLINRKFYVLHPRGIKWKGTPAGVSPTNTECETGTNWERVFEAKNIRIVEFKHKIA